LFQNTWRCYQVLNQYLKAIRRSQVTIHSCCNWFLFPFLKVYFMMTYNHLVIGLFVLMQKGRLLKVNLSKLQQKVWQTLGHIKSLSFKGEGYNKCKDVCRCQITKVHWCYCNVLIYNSALSNVTFASVMLSTCLFDLIWHLCFYYKTTGHVIVFSCLTLGPESHILTLRAIRL
jgi:hypothetical protein